MASAEDRQEGGDEGFDGCISLHWEKDEYFKILGEMLIRQLFQITEILSYLVA